MKLNIYGVSHIARKDRMEEEIRDFIENKDLDAVFLERRDRDATFKEELKASAVNPSIMLWKVIYRFLGHLIVFSKNLLLRRELNWQADDERITEELSEETNLPVHRVDKSMEKSVLDQGAAWSIWSWLIFVTVMYELFSYSFSVQPSETIVSALTGFIIVFTGLFFTINIFIALPFIFSDIEPRNIYMFSNILEISRSKDYEETLLVTGSKHAEGFEELSEIGEIETETEKYRKTSTKRVIGDIIGKFR